MLISLALLLGGVLWLWQSQSSPVATRGDARAAVPSKLSAAPSKPSPERVTKNIEEVRLGDWVLARNPELAAEDRPAELDHRRPDNLRALSLRLQKEDGSWLDLQLLRSPDWLEEHQQGNTVYVDLEELGAKGWADLLAVDPCPEIGPRPHPDCRLVTGRFIHQSADTFDLTIIDTKGETSTTIGLTDNHPIWSADRRQFVQAGSLTIGERLTDTRGETLKVGSIEPRAGPEPVYNLEVDVEHVYFVSDAGLLVHNAYEAQPGPSAAERLPRLKGKSESYIRKLLDRFGFTRTHVSNSPARNERWRHQDGSEVRVHPYGNQNRETYKSANNAHVHKQTPNNQQLNDRGIPSPHASETHIGIRNPSDLPSVRGRPHGVGGP